MGHYEQALRLDPDSAEVHGNLGAALLQVGKLEEAIGHLEQALRLKPENAEAHNNLGVALRQRGRFGEAVREYEQALAVEPGWVSAQNNLAWVLATCGEASVRDGARAVELAEKANQIAGGKDPGILDTLAAGYAEAGRFGDAVRTAQTALELAKGAGEGEAARQIEEKLELYRAGQPYHEGTEPKR